LAEFAAKLSRGEAQGKIAARWSIGERVATPNGFIAEIVSLTKERALIR
jgi:hypothetical protein